MHIHGMRLINYHLRLEVTQQLRAVILVSVEDRKLNTVYMLRKQIASLIRSKIMRLWLFRQNLIEIQNGRLQNGIADELMVMCFDGFKDKFLSNLNKACWRT